MRREREEAELSSRVTAQAAGLPTTIGGFKGHPLYVLARHVVKYQVGAGGWRGWGGRGGGHAPDAAACLRRGSTS
jgi:hypothetical protein